MDGYCWILILMRAGLIDSLMEYFLPWDGAAGSAVGTSHPDLGTKGNSLSHVLQKFHFLKDNPIIGHFNTVVTGVRYNSRRVLLLCEVEILDRGDLSAVGEQIQEEASTKSLYRGQNRVKNLFACG